MFIQELRMYIDNFIQESKKCLREPTDMKMKRLVEFKENLLDGIDYYFDLFPKMVKETQEYRDQAIDELKHFKSKLEEFMSENASIYPQLASIPKTV